MNEPDLDTRARTLFDHLADHRADDWDRQPPEVQHAWRDFAHQLRGTAITTGNQTIDSLLRAWAWLTYPANTGDYATRDAIWHCRENIGRALVALGARNPDNPRPSPNDPTDV